MDKEAKEGTEGGLLESSLSHWLPPLWPPAGSRGSVVQRSQWWGCILK